MMAVAGAGRWLLRREPKVDSLFPSLYLAGRPGKGRSRAGKTPERPPTEPPSAQPPASAEG